MTRGRERGGPPSEGRFGWTRRYRLRWGASVFKSPLAHQYDPRADLGLYGIRGRLKGPIVAPLWHRLRSEALAWHGLNRTSAPTAA
jgi:hypothetical protein